MRIADAQHSRGDAVARAVAHISAERNAAGIEDGALQGKAGAQIRSTAVTVGGRTAEERYCTLQFSVLFFGCGIVKNAQNGTVRHRPQRPLPVVVVRSNANRAQL